MKINLQIRKKKETVHLECCVCVGFQIPSRKRKVSSCGIYKNVINTNFKAVFFSAQAEFNLYSIDFNEKIFL